MLKLPIGLQQVDTVETQKIETQKIIQSENNPNIYLVSMPYTGTVKKVPKNHTILIDFEDLDLLHKYDWQVKSAIKGRGFKGQALCVKEPLSGAHLARLILKVSHNTKIDFLDKNPLNVTRSNLVVIDKKVIRGIKPKKPFISSKYIGVRKLKIESLKSYKDGGARQWKAVLYTKGRQIYLGVHRTEKEAALAYNAGAKKILGESAFLNVIE